MTKHIYDEFDEAEQARIAAIKVAAPLVNRLYGNASSLHASWQTASFNYTNEAGAIVKGTTEKTFNKEDFPSFDQLREAIEHYHQCVANSQAILSRMTEEQRRRVRATVNL